MRGFTLIEVLIAMTLLSIMVVLLFASLKICAQSWEKGESKIEAVNEVAVIYNFFQRHLSAAKPLWDDFSVANQKTFSFHGDAQSLQFVGEFPASAGRGGLQLFSIQQQEVQDNQDVDGTQINVILTPFFPVSEGQEIQKEEVILLKHVKHFSVSYLGIDDTGEVGWQNEWVERETLPRLVKINIGRDDGMYWPDMVVELKVANDTAGLATQDTDAPEEDPEMPDDGSDDTGVME
ncbi:MAG: prepilin-type N-terminal cleavage/methylation domain-containing protein [Methylovulum sp.]|nr:prepilin-type N-terminal cleavage/methylation domain-containing protein [Methylovulum sp.]